MLSTKRGSNCWYRKEDINGYNSTLTLKIFIYLLGRTDYHHCIFIKRLRVRFQDFSRHNSLVENYYRVYEHFCFDSGWERNFQPVYGIDSKLALGGIWVALNWLDDRPSLSADTWTWDQLSVGISWPSMGYGEIYIWHGKSLQGIKIEAEDKQWKWQSAYYTKNKRGNKIQQLYAKKKKKITEYNNADGFTQIAERQ